MRTSGCGMWSWGQSKFWTQDATARLQICSRGHSGISYHCIVAPHLSWSWQEPKSTQRAMLKDNTCKQSQIRKEEVLLTEGFRKCLKLEIDIIYGLAEMKQRFLFVTMDSPWLTSIWRHTQGPNTSQIPAGLPAQSHWRFCSFHPFCW